VAGPLDDEQAESIAMPAHPQDSRSISRHGRQADHGAAKIRADAGICDLLDKAKAPVTYIIELQSSAQFWLK